MYIMKSRQVDDAALAELEKGADMTHKDALLRIVQGLRRVDTGTYALRIRLAEKLGIGTIDINAMAFVGEVDGLTPKDLGRALNITTGSVTAMVDRLEVKGFMVREPNPTDRRSVLLHLSPEGTEAMQWANDHFSAAAVALLKDSSEESLADIAEFLEGIGQRLMAAASAPEED